MSSKRKLGNNEINSIKDKIFMNRVIVCQEYLKSFSKDDIGLICKS